MKTFSAAVIAFLAALPAWGLDQAPRPAESPVALFMYLAVALVLAMGFLYIYWRSRKEREKERRRADRQGRAAG